MVSYKIRKELLPRLKGIISVGKYHFIILFPSKITEKASAL